MPHRSRCRLLPATLALSLGREPQAFTESAAEHKAISWRQSGIACLSFLSFFQMAGSFAARSRNSGEIRGVYIAKKCRTKGVGRALVGELIRLSPSQPGLEQIALGVSTHNTAAKRL
jgi:ribosomal protein S18 acetylase RimI-like enzyme